MNYTENYHLPQWKKEDRIMMEDFNAAMANLEDGLSRAVSGAAADTSSAAAKVAADAAAATARAAAAASAAQATADKAVAAAAAAQKKADAAYAPDQQPYVLGTYTGINAEMEITLGFQPKFVLITGTDSHNAWAYTLAAGNGINSERLEFTSTGFTLKPNTYASNTLQYPTINQLRTEYVYIAFR